MYLNDPGQALFKIPDPLEALLPVLGIPALHRPQADAEDEVVHGHCPLGDVALLVRLDHNACPCLSEDVGQQLPLNVSHEGGPQKRHAKVGVGIDKRKDLRAIDLGKHSEFHILCQLQGSCLQMRI